MASEKKESKSGFYCRLSADVLAKLRALSTKENIKQGPLVERLLKSYFEVHKQ